MVLANYLYMFHYAAYMTFMQLMVVFLFIKLDRNRKQSFMFLLVFSLIMYGAQYYFNIPCNSLDGTSSYWAANLIHAVNTFVMLGIVAINSNEFFPRNYVLVFIYYDLLSTVARLVYNVTFDKIFVAMSAVPAHDDMYACDCLQDLWSVPKWYFSLIVVIAVGFTMNKSIKRLLSRIPNGICTAGFVLSFASYVIGLFSFRQRLHEAYDGIGDRGEAIFNMNSIFVVAGILLIYCIVRFANTNAYSLRVQKAEQELQYEYYANIASLHNQVRSIRHDIVNHMTVMALADESRREEYKSSLELNVDNLHDALNEQVAWRIVDSRMLSKRERYEVYRFGLQMMNRCHGTDMSIETTFEGNSEVIKLVIPCEKKARVFSLKRDSFAEIVAIIAKFHGGKVRWTTEAKSLRVVISIEK